MHIQTKSLCQRINESALQLKVVWFQVFFIYKGTIRNKPIQVLGKYFGIKFILFISTSRNQR